MAMSATLALSSATVTSGQSFGVSLTVSNTGASAVNVLSIDPSVSVVSLTNQTVSSGQGAPFLSAGSVRSVPPSGSLVFTWNDVVYAPAPLSGNGFAWDPSSIQYSVSAVVRSDDGSVFSPTAQTLTVNPPK